MGKYVPSQPTRCDLQGALNIEETHNSRIYIYIYTNAAYLLTSELKQIMCLSQFGNRLIL